MTNRLLSSIILLTITTLLAGCKKIDQLTHFDYVLEESMIIPSSLGINLPFNLLTPAIKTNSESTFEINNTHKNLIEQIHLTSLELDLTSPENGELDFLKSIEIYFRADGLDETLTAWKNEVPPTIGKHLKLNTSDIDLKEFIKKDELELKVTTITDELLLSNHEIKIRAVLRVDARILGI